MTISTFLLLRFSAQGSRCLARDGQRSVYDSTICETILVVWEHIKGTQKETRNELRWEKVR